MSQRTMRRPAFPASPFNNQPVAPPVERLVVDDRLTHDRHGLGRVVRVEGDGSVIVDFGSTVRRVIYPNAKVTKL
ncbi:MAG: hypothetical protein ICV70_07585 [Jiangellaceae bacterium]|nr:hypothetical protein [Jiangellaceae bacterium]